MYTVSKRIPDVIHCSLRKDCQILIIFGTNIPDTTRNQMTMQVSTSPNVCFCTTWEKQNRKTDIHVFEFFVCFDAYFACCIFRRWCRIRHWVRWELERSFDGQWCQKYLYQKLLKSDNPCSSCNR